MVHWIKFNGKTFIYQVINIMIEFQHHFQTDPRDEDWVDSDQSDYDSVSWEQEPEEYVDDDWDY